jgi:hypothetical protein
VAAGSVPWRRVAGVRLFVLAMHGQLNIITGHDDVDLDRAAADDAVLDVRLAAPAGLVHVERQRLAAVGALGFDVHNPRFRQ